MSSYRDTTWASHLRLAVLQVLAGMPDYRSNSRIIRDFADGRGIAANHDQVKTELGWLAEQGLVEIDRIDGGTVIAATVTERGVEVAAGRSLVDGIQRPAPRR